MRPAWLCLLVLPCACGGPDDRPARWSYIYPAVIQPSCATAGCHSKLTRTAGLELESAAESYSVLVGPDGTGNLVVPGQPDQSKLMFLLRGVETRRMPPDGPLPDADIRLVERWILDGAPP